MDLLRDTHPLKSPARRTGCGIPSRRERRALFTEALFAVFDQRFAGIIDGDPEKRCGDKRVGTGFLQGNHSTPALAKDPAEETCTTRRDRK